MRTGASVDEFIAAVGDERQRADAERLHAIFAEETGDPGAMWGTAIVGYGSCAAPTGTWMRVGFSPRSGKLAIYVMMHPAGYEQLLERLGPHTVGKACLYVTRLERVDEDVLREIVRGAWAASQAAYVDA
jgi:hypothetical protein